VQNGIHMISGLPRAGSTLLGALLRQNPALHAGMTSPVGGLFSVLRRELSATNETSVFVDDAQREAMLRGLFTGYYQAIHPTHTVIDTNRLWCSQLHAVSALFPEARVIACVRHLPWIIDSIETLIRRNLWQTSKIFDFEAGGTVWSRANALTSANGLVGFAWNALKQAYYSNESDRMMVLTYDTLTNRPGQALEAVYAFLGLEHFEHDFENIEFDATDFDARIGTPGLHTVRPSVGPTERRTILPPDLWARFEGDSFWRDPKLNLRGVKVV